MVHTGLFSFCLLSVPLENLQNSRNIFHSGGHCPWDFLDKMVKMLYFRTVTSITGYAQPKKERNKSNDSFPDLPSEKRRNQLKSWENSTELLEVIITVSHFLCSLASHQNEIYIIMVLAITSLSFSGDALYPWDNFSQS